jgi:hypothetical protein
MAQSISWHFRTSPQQSWSTQIIEDTEKQWKAQKILLPGFVLPTNKTTTCSIVGFKSNFSPLPFHAGRRRRKNKYKWVFISNTFAWKKIKDKEARRLADIATQE